MARPRDRADTAAGRTTRLVALTTLMPSVSFVVAAALSLLAGCQRADQPAPTPAPAAANTAGAAAREEPSPVQEMEDYRLTETSRGVRQWVLDSTRMRRYSGREEVELVDVHMDFFREGEHFSVLEADSGRVNPRTRAVHVWGQVDITTDDGRRLQTEDLLFDNGTGRITNEVFNRFTRGDDVLTGTGLDATPDLEYVEIKHQVTAEVADDSPSKGPLP
jgi:LPS export ABC transporter protein LptC